MSRISIRGLSRATGRGSWLVLLAGAALLAFLGWLAAANLAQAGVTSVSVASGTAAPGGSVTVNVTAVVTDPGLGAYDVSVVYDATKVSPTGCTAGAGVGACNVAAAPNTVRLAGISSTALTGSVLFGSITFQCGSATGSGSLDLSVVTLADPSQVSVTAGAVNDSSITCAVATPTATPTATATRTPTPTPTATPAALPPTGGSPSDGSGPMGWVIPLGIALGLALAGWGAWSVSRMRRESR